MSEQIAPRQRVATTAPGGAGRHKRMPALDGLRGIGIVAVVVFHLNPSWLPGGYLGVDVFFVVSGFLITGLLLDLFSPGAPIAPALRQFWARRARRLLPALVVLLFATAVAACFVAHDAVPELRVDVPAALAFVANWRFLLHHDNYFQAIGRPPLLQHLWSLGVEEQFYLIWPFVVLGVVVVARRSAAKVLLWSSLGLSLASAVAMGVLFVPGHDASNVYYNTFCHASGLLIGGALAAATRGSRPPQGATAARRRARVGFVALAGLGGMLVFLASYDTFTYRGGIFLASALTGLVLVLALQPGPVQGLLCVRPLRYLGTRSYSLYLWHWPVIQLTRPDIDIALSGVPLLTLRLVLMLSASEISYRFVEQPFRTGRAQAAIRAWRRASRNFTLVSGTAVACAVCVTGIALAVVNPPPLSPALAAGSTPAARAHLVAASATTTTTVAPPPTTTATRGATATTTTVAPQPATSRPATPAPGRLGGGRAPGPHTSPTATTSSTTSTSSPNLSATSTPSAAGRRHLHPQGHKAHSTGKAHPARRSKLGKDYLAIGDSVMVAASVALEQRLHDDIVVDAAISRQVWTGIDRLQEYKAGGYLAGLKAVIIGLGTNGPMTPQDVAQIRALCAGVPLLVFVNVRVPDPWQSETNDSLAAVAHQPGVRVADWYKASAAPGALWPDGIHPDPEGQVIYANLIAAALGLTARTHHEPKHKHKQRASPARSEADLVTAGTVAAGGQSPRP
ncbi:MAG TPA: acyltransferase family protein [Acidimicrobiales bacterium]|nr:acyltransferase family protein [Acidimicrobiales bacterium]